MGKSADQVGLRGLVLERVETGRAGFLLLGPDEQDTLQHVPAEADGEGWKEGMCVGKRERKFRRQ